MCLRVRYRADMATQKLLYTKRETAELLSLSPRTIDNLIARNELRVKRVGKRVLIISDSLHRFVNGRRRTAFASAE